MVNPGVDDPFAAPQNVPGSLPTPAPVLSFVADTLPAGQVVSVPVMLGSAGAPADSLHGISFSFSYNPNVMQALYFVPSASWLGDPANGLLCLQQHFPGQHRLDIALTRTDGLPAGGYGEIGRTFIVIEDDIFFKQHDLEIEWSAGGGSGAVHTTLLLRNVRAMTPSNTRLEIAQQSTQIVVVKNIGVGARETWKDAVRLAPNPVSGLLRVESPDNPLQSIRVTDMAGRSFWNRQCEGATFQEIPVSGWPRGVYIAELQTKQGRCFKKFICQ